MNAFPRPSPTHSHSLSQSPSASHGRARRRWLPAALLGWLALLLAPPAHALCVAPLCACSVVTTALAFGSINPLAGPHDSTGTVRVSCGGVAGLLIPYRIELGSGQSGNVLARRLQGGVHQMAYGLYSDAARTTTWGDGGSGMPVDGAILLDVAGLSPPVVHTVYGRIPGGQMVAPGSYADTLVVTLTYY